MAEHLWSLLCERYLVDPESEVISLMDVRENVTVEGLTQMLEEATHQGKKGALVNTPTLLVSWWFRSRAEEETLHARYVFVSPDGKQISERVVVFPWHEGNPFSRIFVKFDPLPCSMPGLHWFLVEQRREIEGSEPQWDLITRLPLHIGPA
jgi:hypothetical protein